MDEYFKLEYISRTQQPHKVVYAAMHQDYFEDLVADDMKYIWKTEVECAAIVVERLLSNHRGHFGCFEHPQITLNAGFFPHTVMQQLRTHRIGVSFDVQSTRYTGQRVIDVVDGKRDIEEVFYFRPPGKYTDRQGRKYAYDSDDRYEDIEATRERCKMYAHQVVDKGYSYEHARQNCLGYNLRQHFVVSFNARSLMHVLDLRSKKDAELEIQQFCELLYREFYDWMPETALWYDEHRRCKARLSP